MDFDLTNDQQRRDDQFARHYGEAKILEIGEGTTDVHRLADVRDRGFSA